MIDKGFYVLAHLPSEGSVENQDALTMQTLEYIAQLATEVKSPHGFN